MLELKLNCYTLFLRPSKSITYSKCTSFFFSFFLGIRTNIYLKSYKQKYESNNKSRCGENSFIKKKSEERKVVIWESSEEKYILQSIEIFLVVKLGAHLQAYQMYESRHLNSQLTCQPPA